MLAVLVSSVVAVGLGGAIVFGRGILPGVQANGIALGSMSQAQAETALADGAATATLVDQERRWPVDAAQLGITLDVVATAQRAYETGRSQGDTLQSIFGRMLVAPVYTVDTAVAHDALLQMAGEQFDLAPVNAGIALVDDEVVATPPQMGRQLDPAATADLWQREGYDSTIDGWPLVMREVIPPVSDASGMVQQARQLLAQNLSISLFDPVDGQRSVIDVPSDTWRGWVEVSIPDGSETPVMTADTAAVEAYLAQHIEQNAGRSIDLSQAAAALSDAFASGDLSSVDIVVRHGLRQHTVQPGETLMTIGWDYGIPYLYIQQANDGIESLSVGQTITLPAADEFLLKPVVTAKRIVVSISQQRTRVYENDQLIWDWPSSTGISSSPTWPGVYQIISHEPNAYAANWDLYMPDFMGVYLPVPGADFTNGFHGFPTRGGGQLLWENSLGTRVTYGCILLSNENVQLLYDWAEEGVVVEILP